MEEGGHPRRPIRLSTGVSLVGNVALGIVACLIGRVLLKFYGPESLW